jgi:hypothetical protein
MRYLINMSLLCGLIFYSGCSGSTDTLPPADDLTAPQTQPSETLSVLKVGGIYISKNKDSTYSATKIIAMDDFAVHIRIYQNKFKTRPSQLSSDTLKVLIGHAPLDKNGFLSDKPELITVETVKDAELEGYKIYLEEMSKTH